MASWQGKYFQYEDVEMYPNPRQSPLPVYVGGNNENAYRRAALYGNGWLPAGMPVEHLREKIYHFRQLLDEQDRTWEEMDVAMQLIAYVGTSHEQAVDRFRRSQMYKHLVSLGASTLKEHKGSKYERTNLIGTPDEIVEKVKQFEEAGVKHLCGTYFCADSVDELLDQMQIFAEEVTPHL